MCHVLQYGIWQFSFLKVGVSETSLNMFAVFVMHVQNLLKVWKPKRETGQYFPLKYSVLSVISSLSLCCFSTEILLPGAYIFHTLTSVVTWAVFGESHDNIPMK